MIDASEFAASYNAFWHSHAPMCENFIRLINLAESKRFNAPIEEKSQPGRRAIVAEYAFSLAVEHLKRRGESPPLQKDMIEIAKKETFTKMAPFERLGVDITQDYSADEKYDINQLYGIIYKFFKDMGLIVSRPIFKGCGFIDASEGDILVSDTLFEIKSVKRLFRSQDLRQVITYCALNYPFRQHNIKNIGLFNPKLGLYWEGSLDYACRQIAGRSDAEFCDEIVRAISSGEISR